ncbi:YopX family protein [Campylobacter mucosalis]|uniref:YopX family protein n=1 Tax=Campylobacter mucosalis TaxID=202 RepID=UPI0014703582|nr:YopX family protein [Campylobacter mucosalis]
MREIKFRVWDEVNKKMLPVMQSVGLKDKHGIDIYEGDIISPFVDGDELDIDVIVFYDDECFAWRVNTGAEILFLYEFLDLHKDVVVIGNIYEN